MRPRLVVVMVDLRHDGLRVLPPLVPATARRPAVAVAKVAVDAPHGLHALVVGRDEVDDEARVPVDREMNPNAPELCELLVRIHVVQRAWPRHAVLVNRLRGLSLAPGVAIGVELHQRSRDEWPAHDHPELRAQQELCKRDAHAIDSRSRRDLPESGHHLVERVRVKRLESELHEALSKRPRRDPELDGEALNRFGHRKTIQRAAIFVASPSLLQPRSRHAVERTRSAWMSDAVPERLPPARTCVSGSADGCGRSRGRRACARCCAPQSRGGEAVPPRPRRLVRSLPSSYCGLSRANRARRAQGGAVCGFRARRGCA